MKLVVIVVLAAADPDHERPCAHPRLGLAVTRLARHPTSTTRSPTGRRSHRAPAWFWTWATWRLNPYQITA